MPTDHLLPRFHIRPPRGYLNDPNGPIQVGDTTHLYFQYRPSTDTEVPVEWGHASSPDLVTWRLHRPAMAPEPGGPDTDGCWSGNTILEDENVRVFYSGRRNDLEFQPVITSLSRDGGATFDAPELIGLDPDPEEGITMFRDPFAWQADDGLHLVVGAAGPDQTASIRHYRRTEAGWSYIGDLASLTRQDVDGNDSGEGWECPQIYNLDGRALAVVSSWSHADGPANVLAFFADQPERAVRVDDGPSFYAASAMRTSPYGPLMFGWITEGRSPDWWHEDGWAGTISLPRTVALGPDGGLRFAPVRTIDGLRSGSGSAAVDGGGVEIGAQAEISVPHVDGTVLLEFGEAESVEITVDTGAGTLVLDGRHASRDDRAEPWRIVVDDAYDTSAGAPALRLFLDGSVIEAFTSAGRVATARVYPTQPPPWRLKAPAGALTWRLHGADAR
ncbi:glycoside hydrolase family 32 protein [Nocardioides luteus]|uniref:glycoside hydrolase family 32 protein n=1 Tax=Nocardioides luteus TaxID=1844 RepID=UPI0018C98436|nr:glycoside hydrolase family 32 protein [Nocardioides luteus]MBG6095737.1 beta-fructofuranosidase [Nocardioides luteus]